MTESGVRTSEWKQQVPDRSSSSSERDTFQILSVLRKTTGGKAHIAPLHPCKLLLSSCSHSKILSLPQQSQHKVTTGPPRSNGEVFPALQKPLAAIYVLNQDRQAGETSLHLKQVFLSLLPVYSLILLFCNSSSKHAKPKLVPNQNISAVYLSREEHMMVARSLVQDGSRSLQSSQEWLMLVGHETSLVQHERRTKATLEVAFDPLSCLVGRGHQRGENPGQRQSLPTQPSPSAPARPPASPLLFPVGPKVVFPDTLPPRGMSHPALRSTAIPAPVLVVSAVVLP